MTAHTRKLFFPAGRFFSNDFPFSLTRMRHTPQDYDESVRCRREFWKIVYVINGNGDKIINNRLYPFAPGSLFVIHPDDETTYAIASEHIDIYNVLFMPAIIEDELKALQNEYDFFAIFGRGFRDSSHELRQLLYVLDSNREIEPLIKRMDKELRQEKSNYRNMIRLHLLELLILASRLSTRKIASDRKHNIVSYVSHVISEHFHEEFSLDDLAARIGVSKNHLCRIYKQERQRSIMEDLLEKRLLVAQAMLIDSQRNISEICFDSGFNNLSYFYRAFARRFQLNPGEFRRRNG